MTGLKWRCLSSWSCLDVGEEEDGKTNHRRMRTEVAKCRILKKVGRGWVEGDGRMCCFVLIAAPSPRVFVGEESTGKEEGKIERGHMSPFIPPSLPLSFPKLVSARRAFVVGWLVG